jgi:hypothetical protein
MSNNAIYCPQCKSSQVEQVKVPFDKASGEIAKKPLSFPIALGFSVPIGLFCLYMLIRFGFGSGLGVWILGLAIAIATPIYAWQQSGLYTSHSRVDGYSCGECGYFWMAGDEPERPRPS